MSVEPQFSVNSPQNKQTPEFAILQLRPMSAREELGQVKIDQRTWSGRSAFPPTPWAMLKKPICRHTVRETGYLRSGHTPEIAREIGELNHLYCGKANQIPSHRSGPMGVGRSLAGDTGNLGENQRGGRDHRNRITANECRTLARFPLFP